MEEALREQILASARHYYRDTLGLPDWDQRSERRLNRAYETYMFSQLIRHTGPLQGKSVLDLGCGWGGVVLNAGAEAGQVVGIEPDTERLDIARQLRTLTGADRIELVEGVGEDLPFPDNSFDVVASYQVLEHVQDPARVMEEVSRVLKPGGLFHFSTPNYLAFFEPHYKILWLPLMPKWLGRLYLRLRGRQPDFVNHIQYVNPISIRRMLRHNGLQFTDLHLQSAGLKLDRILARFLGWIPGWDRIARRTRPVTSKLLYATHTCFLNRDQEYIASKA